MKKSLARLGLIFAATTMLMSANLAHADNEVTVGVPIAVTGPFVFSGVPMRNGMTLAQEQLAADNFFGDVKVKFVFDDTAGDKNQATTLVTRMSEYDKVDLILGPTSSVESFAALPVAQANSTPVLTASSADVSVIGDWIFKATATPYTIMAALADRALADLKPKKVVYVFNRDNDAYIAQKDGLKRVFDPAGVEVVAEETIVGADTDFTALATKLAATDFDTLVISTTAELSANIIIQAKMAGLSDKVRILGTPSMASAKFIEVGGAAVEGTVFVADWFVNQDSELNKRFVAEYKAKFGTPPDVFAALGYTQLMEGATAIKNAGPDYDRKSIRDAIASLTDMPTILGNGSLTISEKRTPNYGGFVLTVKEGTFQAF